MDWLIDMACEEGETCVHGEDSCPRCGEDREEALVWLDDNYCHCGSCGRDWETE